MIKPDFNKICLMNLIDYWKTIALYRNLLIQETEQYVCINTGMHGSAFNPAFLKTPLTELPEIENKTHFSFWLNQETTSFNPNELELLMHPVPIMSIRLDQEFPLPSLPIEKVKNNELSEWIIPVEAAFSMDKNSAQTYQNSLEHSAPHFIQFVARKGDKVVGAATLFLHKEIAGLYNISVLPEYRKQGIATALHLARLHEAQKQGYNYATLQATPMGIALDQRLGFKTHLEMSIYKY